MVSDDTDLDIDYKVVFKGKTYLIPAYTEKKAVSIFVRRYKVGKAVYLRRGTYEVYNDDYCGLLHIQED